MAKNKTYKRMSKYTSMATLAILGYLESLDITFLRRHISDYGNVYYTAKVKDGDSVFLSELTPALAILPPREVVAFNEFMGKVYKRYLRRYPVGSDERLQGYQMDFLLSFLRDNGDVDIKEFSADNIKRIHELVKSSGKVTFSSFLKSLFTVSVKESDEVGKVDVKVSCNTPKCIGKDFVVDDTDFTYIKDTFMHLYAKGYRTIEVGDEVLAVVQEYTADDVKAHRVSRKTYLNISSTFDMLGLRGALKNGVYAITDILNLPHRGDVVYMDNKPYYAHSVLISLNNDNPIKIKYMLYPNHLSPEMHDLLGEKSGLDWTYKISGYYNSCCFFIDTIQKQWDIFITKQ